MVVSFLLNFLNFLSFDIKKYFVVCKFLLKYRAVSGLTGGAEAQNRLGLPNFPVFIGILEKDGSTKNHEYLIYYLGKGIKLQNLVIFKASGL